MNKRTYERASLEVIALDTKDIITTSPIHDGNSGSSIVLPDDNFDLF